MAAPQNLGEQIHPKDAVKEQSYYYLQDGSYKKIKVKDIPTHELNNYMPEGSPFGLYVVSFLPENTEGFIAFRRDVNLNQSTKLFKIKQTGGRHTRRIRRKSATRRYRR